MDNDAIIKAMESTPEPSWRPEVLSTANANVSLFDDEFLKKLNISTSFQAAVRRPARAERRTQARHRPRVCGLRRVAGDDFRHLTASVLRRIA
jgi:hypothetical protein